MRNIRILCAFILSLIVLSSCDKKKCYRHFVDAYITSFEGITANEGYSNSNIIPIRIDRKKYRTYINEDDASGLFERLSSYNQDMSYNRIARTNTVEFFMRPKRVFLSEQIVDVDVTSDVAWDAVHPAGSSLKDLFIFFSSSPDSYIRSGYRDIDRKALNEFFMKNSNQTLLYYGKCTLEEFLDTFLPFGGKLSELNLKNYYLIRSGHYHLFLLFPAVPIPAPETKVTVSMTLSNGKTYTASKILKQQ